MAQMPDIANELGPVEGFARRVEHDAAEFMRDIMRPHGRRHQDLPQPAAAPPPPSTAIPQEDSVSLAIIAEIEDAAKAAAEHAAAMAAKFEQVDRGLLADVDAIQANPETAEVLAILRQLAPAAAGTLATALGVLHMTLAAAGGQLPAQPAA